MANNTAPTFNTGNGTTINQVGGDDHTESVAIPADGGVVVVGRTAVQDKHDDRMALVRFNAGGGTESEATLTSPFTASGVVVQPDGKVLVGGNDYIIVRFNANGTLDTSFDGDGRTAPQSGFGGSASSLAVQPDGKILAGGESGIIRFNPDGSLDPTFDGDGRLPVGSSPSEQMLALLPDGKILAVHGDLRRYNTDGSLDLTFTGDGQVTLDLTGFSRNPGVAVQPDGKILVSGNNGNSSGLLFRFNADGSPDTTFDGDGRVSIAHGVDSGEAPLIRPQPDGKILVGGTGIVRYNADGSLDPTFDRDGMLTSIRADGLALHTDGKIVFAHTIPRISNTELTKFAATRLNPDGSADPTFGTGNSLGGTRAYTEDAPPIALDSNVSVFDAELSAQGHYAGATLTVARSGAANAQDVFSALGALGPLTQGSALVHAGITVGTVTTNSAGRLVLTFDANATQDRVDGVMQAIGYSNTSDYATPPPAPVDIVWTFSDGNAGAQGTGGAGTVSGSIGVTFAAGNDAPTAAILPTIYAIDGGNKVVLQGTGLSVADSDGDINAAAMTVTVSALSGTLTATTGTTGVAISGSGTHSVTLSARLHQINNLLAGNFGGTLTYSNDSKKAVTDTLTLSINDNGNTGAGGPKIGSDTAVIDLQPIPVAPLVLPPADYNGDGKADVLLRNTSGQIWEYQMNGLAIQAQGSVDTPTAVWRVAGNGDYNGDGKSDVLLRNDSTGLIWQYQMNGLQIAAQGRVDLPTTQWKVVGNGDYNGDGKADVLLRHDTTGEIWQYQMNGIQIAAQGRVDLPTTQWKIVGNADYNGDGKADVLLRNDATGEIWQYQMNGLQIAAQGRVDLPDTSWKVVGNGDYNGDGKADVLLRNDATGQIWQYQMDGLRIAGQASIDSPETHWKVVGDGDYNGDGKADVLLKSDVLGDVWQYQMDGLRIGAQGLVDKPDTNWKVVASGDYNGDGNADVLLRNDVTGQVWEYQMNGLHLMAQALVDSPNTSWAIVG